MMALPLTWRPGAANPFGQGPKMRSIPVCHVDYDLCRTAQGGLERAQAVPAERALGGPAAPKIDNPAAWVEGRPQRTLSAHALRGGDVLVRKLAGHDAVQRTPNLQRGLACV